MCDIPTILHPMAESALWHYLSGEITALTFLRYAALAGSDNLPWAVCLIGG